ncbi:hypothetical protein FBU30_010953 [Linnemannia zychae]|nr:hypothetical protein FBU30_010953 [Linnemannia zychae]
MLGLYLQTSEESYDIEDYYHRTPNLQNLLNTTPVAATEVKRIIRYWVDNNGIPCAEPPIGHLRFQKPIHLNPPKRGGVNKTNYATRFGNACMQLPLDGIRNMTSEQLKILLGADQSEDCPVPIFEPGSIVSRGGVVVVTIRDAFAGGEQTGDDARFARHVIDRFTTFAETGNPNPNKYSTNLGPASKNSDVIDVQ